MIQFNFTKNIINYSLFTKIIKRRNPNETMEGEEQKEHSL